MLAPMSSERKSDLVHAVRLTPPRIATLAREISLNVTGRSSSSFLPFLLAVRGSAATFFSSFSVVSCRCGAAENLLLEKSAHGMATTDRLRLRVTANLEAERTIIFCAIIVNNAKVTNPTKCRKDSWNCAIKASFSSA